MAKRGKKYTAARENIDRERRYPLAEAVALVKQNAFAKFDETLEIHIRTNVDPRNSEQQVRGTVALPHGTGKEVRVVVFAQGDAAQAAKDAGADEVGAAELAEKISGGWMEFDAVIASPDMMREVGKLGRVLGPRGLMPNPKTGTVTPNVAEAVEKLKAGQVEYRVDRTRIIHAALGKCSFSEDQMAENVHAYLDAIIKARPASLKGIYLRSVTLNSTMGPAVKINSDGA